MNIYSPSFIARANVEIEGISEGSCRFYVDLAVEIYTVSLKRVNKLCSFVFL
jgi:hypothetical protein